MPAKTAFLLASYQLRVSEDWVVADAAKRNRAANRENNREFLGFSSLCGFSKVKKPCAAVTSRTIPYRN